MDNISISKAKIEDVLRISILLKTVYIQTYASEGITFEFANFIEKRFSLKYITDIINENPDQLVISHFKNNPIGVAEIIFESKCPIRNIPVPELSKLYVLERFYGKGIGYGLLSASEKLLKEKGYKEFYLEVYYKNTRAIRFYERQGYKIIGNTDFRIENSVYKNFAMNKVL